LKQKNQKRKANHHRFRGGDFLFFFGQLDTLSFSSVFSLALFGCFLFWQTRQVCVNFFFLLFSLFACSLKKRKKKPLEERNSKYLKQQNG
jgi:hypothetical protein